LYPALPNEDTISLPETKGISIKKDLQLNFFSARLLLFWQTMHCQ
jgi:hypothetical protein